jgi:membrane-bound ClpP family serine protease
MAKQTSTPSTLQFAFTKKNYQLMGIGIVILIVGYALMTGGGSADPNVFNPEIFSFRRITLAPIIILFGYGFIGYAIMYKAKKNEPSDSQK